MSRYESSPHPPRDDELRNTIENVAEFVAKYGPESEEKTRRENPRFEFLFGGPYSDYYKYCLHSALNQNNAGNSGEIDEIHSQIEMLRQQLVDSERNLQAQQDSQVVMRDAELNQQIFAAEEQKIAAYLTNVNLNIESFKLNLEQLNGTKCSKDAISAAKKFVLDNCSTDQQREVILTYLLNRVRNTSATDHFRLNILYLINDWAHHCQRKKLDPVAQTLSRYVPQMYAYTIENTTDTTMHQKLEKLTGVWEGHKYFNDQCFKQLRNPSNILLTSKTAQAGEYAKLSPTIEAQLQAIYAGYEQQHTNFAHHVRQQIAALELKVDKLRHPEQNFAHSSNSHENQPRKSRFDQQSRYEERPSGNFGRFFGSPVRSSQPQQNWTHEESAAPDGDDIDGHPFNEDDLIPKVPYYNLPAGVIVAQVPVENLTYNAINTSALRLPPPLPPSQRLLDAMDAFYAPPSLDKPRDPSGWERDGLADFFDRKLRLKQILQERLETEGKTLESLICNKMNESDVELVKKDRETFVENLLAEKRKKERRSRSRSRGSSNSRSSSGSSRSSRGRRSRSSSSSSSSSSGSRSRSPRKRRHSRSESPQARKGFKRGRSPSPPSFSKPSISFNNPISGDNKGALLMQKMGWGGQGLGAKESGIVEPINPGEVRDKVSQFRGLGSAMDPYEEFRKQRSGNFRDRVQHNMDRSRND